MIHLYWHTKPPPELQLLVATWEETNEITTRLWTPAELPDLAAKVEATNERVLGPDRVRHGANVARWALLNEYGGMWADTDVTPLQDFGSYGPIERLVDPSEPWCAAIGSQATPFVCGGPAGHPIWQRALAESLDHPEGGSPHASGGLLLGRVVGPHELLLIPANLFAAHDSIGRTLAVPAGGRLSDHGWATSSRRPRMRR